MEGIPIKRIDLNKLKTRKDLETSSEEGDQVDNIVDKAQLAEQVNLEVEYEIREQREDIRGKGDRLGNKVQFKNELESELTGPSHSGL